MVRDNSIRQILEAFVEYQFLQDYFVSSQALYLQIL